MILSAKLTNFRKHTSLCVDFTQGLSVVRGGNENGKSSLLEAVTYALFGSAALRTSFADAVTWGEAESTLKVEIKVQFADRHLTIRRGKSGAEVVESGTVIVTGQKEVSNFIAALIGTSAAVATNLMVVNQGAVRGILASGPKDSSLLIEKLANFDLLSDLIEAMPVKLMLGNTGLIEAEIESAMAAANACAPVEPDFATMESELARLNIAYEKVTEEHKALAAAMAAAVEAEMQCKVRVGARDDLARQLKESELRTIDMGANKIAASKAAATLDYDKVDDARTAVEAAKGNAVRMASYAAVQALPTLTSVWEGDVASLRAEIASAKSLLRTTELAQAAAYGDVRVLESKLVASAMCSFCGKDVSQWPEVLKRNGEILGLLEIARNVIAESTDEIDEQKIALSELEGVLLSGEMSDAIAIRLDELVSVNWATYPPKITWRGAVPVVTDVAQAQKRLAEAELVAKNAAASASKVATLTEMLELEAVKAIALTGKLQAFADVDRALREFVMQRAKADQACSSHAVEVTAAGSAVWVADQALTQARTAWHAALTVFETARSVLESKKALLEEMQFNNALLKKVRAARPIVANKLWNTVLASVSSMFTRMRGEQSVVTKGKDGFLVNGQNVEALSGSTLDLLALAIRVSMIKVFLPTSNFMMLDEAGAACDASRSTAMYGFLKAAGFDQVILVTHDSIAEAVADQLIEI